MTTPYYAIASQPLRARVYIASPYAGNKPQGVARQIDMWRILSAYGFHPIAPLLLHFVEREHPDLTPLEAMSWDLQEVRQADALLRLPGDSPGADREVTEALHFRVPVFYTLDSLLAWARAKEHKP